MLSIKTLRSAHIGKAESYCNQVFCVCVFYQTLRTTNNIAISIKQPEDLELYKNQNERQAFLKLIVMTIFTTHDCCFTTFRRLLVAKEYMET